MIQKFALTFRRDGQNINIRNIEALRENFNIHDVMRHFNSQSLQRWLQSRGYESELESIRVLKEDIDNFLQSNSNGDDVVAKLETLILELHNIFNVTPPPPPQMLKELQSA